MSQSTETPVRDKFEAEMNVSKNLIQSAWERFRAAWPEIIKKQSTFAFKQVEHVHDWKDFDDIGKYGVELVLVGRWCGGCGMIQKHEGPAFGWVTQNLFIDGERVVSRD